VKGWKGDDFSSCSPKTKSGKVKSTRQNRPMGQTLKPKQNHLQAVPWYRVKSAQTNRGPNPQHESETGSSGDKTPRRRQIRSGRNESKLAQGKSTPTEKNQSASSDLSEEPRSHRRQKKKNEKQAGKRQACTQDPGTWPLPASRKTKAHDGRKLETE
jgi:hypothetical protein